MNTPNLAQLKGIASSAQSPCVSMFLPTHRAGTELQQDRIRLENALREAERQLGAAGHEVGSLLAEASALRSDHEFWAHQGDGLAIYCHAGGIAIHRVPLNLPDLVFVGDRPMLRPLLPLVSDGAGRYRVLVLTQQAVRVYEGDRHGLNPLEVENLPQRVEDVVGDARESGSQQHSAGAASISHGQTTSAEVQKQEMEKFVRAVNDALHAELEGRILPLVIAAVDHVASAFRGMPNARRVVDTLSGNFEHLDARQLHEKAFPLVSPEFERERHRVADLVREGLGTGKVVQRIEEIVVAAHEGRVETMLVAYDTARWGRFDPDSGQVEIHDERQEGDEDLLDLAATATLMQGGRVYAEALADMPGDDAKGAAVLRY